MKYSSPFVNVQQPRSGCESEYSCALMFSCTNDFQCSKDNFSCFIMFSN